MTTAKQVFAFLDRLAPVKLQMSFDNSGFLVGEENRAVKKILVALDITLEVAEEAAAWGAELIVSHHPVIFDPLRSVTDREETGRILIQLIRSRIGAICMHTNLDAVQGGVNDVLAEAAGLCGVAQLHQDGVDDCGFPYGIGRVGTLAAPLTCAEFAAGLKTALHAGGLRCYDAGRPVFRVAVGSGSCGSMLPEVVAAGCDTFITSEVKHDVFLSARAAAVNLIDAGHFSTENPVCDVLARKLREEFPDLEVEKSRRNGDPVRFL